MISKNTRTDMLIYYICRFMIETYSPFSSFVKRILKPRPGDRYLNLGGGNWYYPRWENVDFYANHVYVDYCLDLRNDAKLPVLDGCAAAVFSSHLFEHITDEDCLFLLGECYRVCKPDGVIRISVPDMDKAYSAYREGNTEFFDRGGVSCKGNTIEKKLVNFFASYATKDHRGGPLVSATEVRNKLRELDKYGFCRWCVSKIPEDATYKAHINAYDFDKLKKFLSISGFRDIERSGYRQSSVPVMRTAAFDNRPIVSLYIEARK